MIHLSLSAYSLVPYAPYVPHLFARGGGGGSGSGGGGGGGGSFIVLIGYVPAHFVTDWFYKHVSELSARIVGIIVAVIVTVICGIISPFFGLLVGIGAAIGVYTGLHNTFSFITKKSKQSKALLDYAAQRDGVWQEAALQQRIKDVFITFQRDWSDFNLESMRTYTSPRYFAHMQLMLTALYQMGRQNLVNDPQILQTSVIDAIDERNNDKDRFTAYVQGKATDVLVRTSDNWPIYTDTSVFEEFWKFDRQVDEDGDSWVLDGIGQATEAAYMAVPALQKFAEQNDMFYSLDMGRLLLPDNGQLFSKAAFGSSDINNHIIGDWNGLIVQLYTYIPSIRSGQADNYLVGQIALPKSYGGIIIRRKRRNWATDIFSSFALLPSGYQRLSMEWPDFNNRYDVLATDMDKVTSFELLNPAYMAKLYDFNLPISIEVVDNIVYFYALVVGADTRYEEMLAVLQGAFRELKM